MSIPVFGEKETGKNYQARYAAYAIIENNGEIIVVKAPNGAYFLPGGEIEGEETKEEAIDREMIEELGMEIVLERYLGQADEYFYSRHRDTYFHNPGYFFVAESWKIVSEPTEETSIFEWVTPEKSLELLKRGSHRWAVEEWLDR